MNALVKNFISNVFSYFGFLQDFIHLKKKLKNMIAAKTYWETSLLRNHMNAEKVLVTYHLI